MPALMILVAGPAVGADEMVALTRRHGKPVYRSLDEVPTA
jgi:hypothetical protein